MRIDTQGAFALIFAAGLMVSVWSTGVMERRLKRDLAEARQQTELWQARHQSLRADSLALSAAIEQQNQTIRDLAEVAEQGRQERIRLTADASYWYVQAQRVRVETREIDGTCDSNFVSVRWSDLLGRLSLDESH